MPPVSLLSVTLLFATMQGSAAIARDEVDLSPRYLIVGSEDFRTRMTDAISRLAVGARLHDQTAMPFISCRDAWAGNRAEASACIQSRISTDQAVRLAVLHDVPAPEPSGTDATCVTTAGWWPIASGTPGNEALRRCFGVAGKPSPTDASSRYLIGSGGLLAPADERAQQRAAAPTIISIAVDDAAQPRGLSGPCHVSGRIRSVRRGDALSQRGIVELSIPCFTRGGRDGARRISMGEIEAGSYADLYLDGQLRLLDYRRTEARTDKEEQL